VKYEGKDKMDWLKGGRQSSPDEEDTDPIFERHQQTERIRKQRR
jgi:hypothetical protein